MRILSPLSFLLLRNLGVDTARLDTAWSGGGQKKQISLRRSISRRSEEQSFFSEPSEGGCFGPLSETPILGRFREGLTARIVFVQAASLPGMN
ncbi:hypothetical protein BDW71DRAFT_182773 [Aspergillus fruticulosus]